MTTRSVAQSLGAQERLLPFLPALLQDLSSIGFDPAPMVRLLQRCRVSDRRDLRVLDLGCGKGVALIRLARQFGWSGEGVDLVPEFVEEARRRAEEAGVGDRVRFEVADMALAARQGGPADLILFGFDSDVLGPLGESLAAAATRLARGGHVVLDTVWARGPGVSGASAMTEAAVRGAVAAAGLVVTGMERLDPDWVRDQDAAIMRRIRRRAEELGRRHPEQRAWFDEYVRSQERECAELEDDLHCAILLLAPAG